MVPLTVVGSASNAKEFFIKLNETSSRKRNKYEVIILHSTFKDYLVETRRPRNRRPYMYDLKRYETIVSCKLISQLNNEKLLINFVFILLNFINFNHI